MKTKEYYQTQNQIIIDEISQTKDLAPNTTKNYKVALNQYSTYHQMTIQELLDEADLEEEQGIRMKKRKIKKRILSFRQHLIEHKKQPLTINTHIIRILTTYKFYEIETPTIPNVKNTKHELIEDIPTKKHIKTALETTNNIGLQALILFMASSGTSRNEALNITIGDFMNATNDYQQEVTIENMIQKLEKQDMIVPTFQLYRQKTHYPYITFCTPEATQKILLYLKYRLNKQYDKIKMYKNDTPFNKESKLFHFSPRVVNITFQRLNDKLGWGMKGTHRFFHPHALRKFFATELLKSDMDSMTIDFLSGRAISKTHQAYFKADPTRLKQKYMQFMNNLMINEEITYRDITSPELQELEYYREKDKQRDEQIARLEQMIKSYQN